MRRKKDPSANLLGRLIGLAGKNMKRRLGHNLARAGMALSAEQIILLGLIRSSEGANQQWLTDQLPHDKTAITRWIDVLENERLVTRVADREDRRQNRIFITKKGLEYTTQIYPVVVFLSRRIEHLVETSGSSRSSSDRQRMPRREIVADHVVTQPGSRMGRARRKINSQ